MPQLATPMDAAAADDDDDVDLSHHSRISVVL